MSKLQMLRVFLNERLTAAAVEIFGAVEKTVAEYQEENDRLRRMLRMTPDIKLPRIDSMQFSLPVCEDEVPPEQQHSEQEWSPSLEQELEPIQIKEEQEDLRTSQEEEQLQWLDADNIEFRFPSSCVKSECDQVKSLTLPQAHNVENRESEFKPVDHTPFDTVTHLTTHGDPCNPPDKNNAFSNSPAVSSDPLGLNSCSLLNLSPPMDNVRSHCDWYEMLALKANDNGHVTLANIRPSECHLCKKTYNSTSKLKAHVQVCHMEEAYTCPFCHKSFQLKGHLSRHMRIHTGEKAFRCGDCGKSFGFKETLDLHILTHTREKPFNCTFCNKRFSQKANLSKHVRTHTGEKHFLCVDCGKNFLHKRDLWRHMLTHTGEKPFCCTNCGKTFNRKDNLNLHMLTHTGENNHK
ncbi:hypothetical protein UPYG_G00067340 [Umbra pygmaea]|uniref:C2H2-type domain-containing protein n=1 Tax=Umbra pygmaea TaxID=75934 RepID=A0ABD0XAR5_UMBPY